MMELVVRLPQLDELKAKLDQLLEVLGNVDTVGAGTACGVELCVKALLAHDKMSESVQPTRRARTAKAPPASTPTASSAAAAASTLTATDANGKDHEDVEDEDALRARVEFEAKRTTRQFGIAATRTVISSVADGALRIDDVPAARLAAALSALQAL